MSHRGREVRGWRDGNDRWEENGVSSMPPEQLGYEYKKWDQERGHSVPLTGGGRIRDQRQHLTLSDQSFTLQGGGSLTSGGSKDLGLRIPSDVGGKREVTEVEGVRPAMTPVPVATGLAPRQNLVHFGSAVADEKVLDVKSHGSVLSPQTSGIPRMISDSVGPGNDNSTVVDPAFMSEWDHIEKSRDENMGLQSQIHETRRVLREKQRAKAIIEDHLFQRVRIKEMGILPPAPNSEEEEPILDLMQRYQKARDDYGPVEDDCNRREDQLYANEFELRRLEADFLAKWKIGKIPPLGLNYISETDGPTAQSGDDEDDEDFDYHPLVEKYLSRLGDLDILRERLQEILEEREQLEEQRQTRTQLGMSLGPEEEEWLNDAQEMEDEVTSELREVEKQVEEMRNDCRSQNLIDEDGEPTNLDAQEKEVFHQEEDLSAGSNISEYSRYPLLSHPRGVVKQTTPEHEAKNASEKSDSIDGRINTWILDILRYSPLDIELLARTYKGKWGDTSEIWEKLVLDTWFHDGTIQEAAAIRLYTHSMKTGADLGSGASTTSSDLFGMEFANSQFGTFRPSPPASSKHSDDTEIADSTL